MKNKKENNLAFIDGQNLKMGLDWNFHHKSFYRYLKDKYSVSEAYYFLGYKDDEKELYENLQRAGFILVFNLKGETLKSNKKGNVDVVLTFTAMKKLIDQNDKFDKIVLVSGDGDYKVLVDYFVEKNRFKKVIAPNLEFASTLYKNHNNLDKSYFTVLDDNVDIRKKIEYKQKKRPLGT